MSETEGGSGAGSTARAGAVSKESTVRSVVNQWAKDHIVGDATPMAFLTEANREDLITRLDQLRADLEAARGEIEQLNQARDMIAEEREAWKASAQQSRAAEAELRARVKRRDAVVDAVRAYVEYCRVTNSVYPSAFATSLDALDAAEQPARAQDGPQQPSEKTPDHEDLPPAELRHEAPERGWLCPHREHSTGECGPMCECTERIRNGTYGRP